MPTGIYERTEEHKRKMSESHKGKIGYWSGKHHTKEVKMSISKSLEGNKNTLGHRHPEETRIKMREAKKCKEGLGKGIFLKANKNSNWKGDGAGCGSKHAWIRTYFGKAKRCIFNPNHIASIYHWANISGKYTRNLIDYAPMCPSCHGLFDRR